MTFFSSTRAEILVISTLVCPKNLQTVSIGTTLRGNLRERQLEGIAVAKAKGIYKGRERGSSMSEDQFLDKYKSVVKEVKNYPELSIRKVAKITGASVGTVQRVKKYCF